ncbi:thioredoxin family protein [Cetobacterium sp.]|uniref:thioredoxin family protein n=1 Tax=Cetobacterium sp. TaxID=2071632 RepID=UPI002FC7B8C7
MLPRLEEFSKEFEGTKFFPIDTKKNPEVAGEFLVFVTPVFIVYYDGMEILKKIRFFSISQIRDELKNFIEKIKL